MGFELASVALMPIALPPGQAPYGVCGTPCLDNAVHAEGGGFGTKPEGGRRGGDTRVLSTKPRCPGWI